MGLVEGNRTRGASSRQRYCSAMSSARPPIRRIRIRSSARRYLDWTVDGEAIGDWFANERNPRYGVTWLVQGDNDPDMIERSLLALLGERDRRLDAAVRFADGRVAILFCPLCGELACGAISAELHFTHDAVEWRALNHQDGLTGEVWTDPPLRSVSFDRQQYEVAIGELLRDWVNRT
ncbi:hypothetical protein [Agrococcus sp. Marseille-Q4369]|uniref:hypothetical protein n=1 Tax=Agrococcus sp. Marseille-Q4369 TaxID=2810513 RepID=UPI001B8BC12A|nr:hypothetical protein [Agrococcus sp. Marseille-Q4369]QUW19082.1 hypothetical protein JSQ78_01535 [Agrococcus sp. Marseille-Q4369]